MLVEFECPRCEGHVCEVWSPKGSTATIRTIYWHWLLNPSVAFVELLFGQRIPARTFVCKSCPLPLPQRSYEYCPECFSFHRSEIWSGDHAIGHWLGVFCPTCGGKIPCLWNSTSRFLLAITAPIWWLPFKLFEKPWIRAEQQRAKQAVISGKGYEPLDYGVLGTWFGVFANIICSIYLISPLTYILDFWIILYLVVWTATLGLLAWLPAGWLFALAMRNLLEKRGDPEMYLSAKDLSGIDLRPRYGMVLAHDPIAELCEAEPQRRDRICDDGLKTGEDISLTKRSCQGR